MGKWTKAAVLEELVRTAERTGRKPRQKDVSDAMRLAAVRLFGSWESSLEAAGLGGWPLVTRDELEARMRDLRSDPVRVYRFRVLVLGYKKYRCFPFRGKNLFEALEVPDGREKAAVQLRGGRSG